MSRGRPCRWRQSRRPLLRGLSWLFWAGIDHPATAPALSGWFWHCFASTRLALAAAAVTAAGTCAAPRHGSGARSAPTDRCAVLWLLCGEAPEPVARRAPRLCNRAATRPEADRTQVFILSDTRDAGGGRRRARAVRRASGRDYRNRPAPEGRKPGNLRDWLACHGAGSTPCWCWTPIAASLRRDWPGCARPWRKTRALAAASRDRAAPRADPAGAPATAVGAHDRARSLPSGWPG